MKRRLSAPLAALLLSSVLASSLFAAEKAVKVWEEPVTIPTYLIGPPDPNPRFYTGTGSQGAQHRIYPYPAYDNLTAEKADKAYKMVYLENQYIKVGVLPESGGKIFEAIDKTNGYNFFYRQHVIKPALISLLGAWISGGVEWDIPHHHRATSFLPVQYTIESHPDGSQTVWVGELELRDRMRWSVGLTLRPGSTCLEASFRMVNRTPLPTSMLCFSNVAVHVDDTYQVIFPPSTQHVTYHGKRSFTTWPIATTMFNNTDFSAGVDVSWYKSHINANSMFAWNYQDDFFAGYDHGKNAGTMSIADHHVAPGKKFWTWGSGPNGHLQDTLLTDNDGPYIELMVGAYSDNQPDYTWLAPYETRTWTQVWYPFRDIDGMKNANTDAAVNLEVKEGKAKVGFYATADHPAATITVRLKDKVLLQEQTAINPGHSYVKEIALPSGADEHDLRVSLTAEGRELIAYTPMKLEPEAMPKPVTDTPRPEQIKTNEELYLAGLRIEQFHAPGAAPDPYWQEALKRDPGDIRVNTALGIDCIKAARYADAEKYLRKALERATAQYTSPKDGEPYYYLALALQGQGKREEAFTQFYHATWSGAWCSPAYFGLAQIASARGDQTAAMEYVERAISANANNIRALGLKAALLRHAGKQAEALAAAEAIGKIDPLDVPAMAERWLAEPNDAHAGMLAATLQAHPATGLETAVGYMNAGLWRDATAILTPITGAGKNSNVSPLVYYTLAYCARQMEQPAKATEYYRLAMQASTELVFPFQREMIDVLEQAMQDNPSDARAPYYLGNLLYDWQPERAVTLWEKSASLGADFSAVYATLATAYARQAATREKVQPMLEKAVQFGGNATAFYELDRLNEEAGMAPDKRLALLEAHQSEINRDEVIAREVNLRIFAGKYDEAINQMRGRFFRAWEGGGRFSVGDAWINAHLLRGQQRLAAKQYQEALADFQAALQFPSTLQEAIGDITSRKGEVAYWSGNAYEAMGQMDKAQQSWREATEASIGQPARGVGRGRGSGPGIATTGPATAPADGTPAPAGRRGRPAMGGLGAGVHVTQAAIYYQAMAFQKLGQETQAQAAFKRLTATPAADPVATGRNLSAAQRVSLGDAHYVLGLGALGDKNKEKAKAEFQAALQASPDHLAAKTALAGLGQ